MYRSIFFKLSFWPNSFLKEMITTFSLVSLFSFHMHTRVVIPWVRQGKFDKKKVLSYFEGYGAPKHVLVSVLIYIFTGFCVDVRNIWGGKVFDTL